MTCDQINSRMIELVYGELAPALADRCRAHAAECAACGAELAALEQTQQVLDAMPPLETRVDLARLCLKSAQRHQQFQTRALWSGAGAAAALLLAAGLLAAMVRVEVAPGQVVLAWRAAGDAVPESLVPRPEIPPAIREDPARETDERFARSGLLEESAPAAVMGSFARSGRGWSQEPTYLATRDRVLALGLDSLERMATRPAAGLGQTTAPASYRELQRQLLDHNERVPPRM